MNITLEKLNKLGACYNAVQWFKQQKTNDIYELFELAKTENHLDWANWYVIQILNKKQKIQYAIFAAKSVLHIYQKRYPDDNRPQKAIEAAEKYLENQTEENKHAAAVANAAAHAVYVAVAAYTAADAAYAEKELIIKIIKYGLSLVKEK